MKIEKFEKKHLDGVVKIEEVCFAHPWSRVDLEKQIELETSHFLVATVDGAAAGYMGLQVFSGEGYVTNIAVLPQYRRRGIARALINEELKNDMDFISLEVRKSNLPAISLYAQCGFERVGVRPNFYTSPDEDAVIMTVKRNRNEEK